jgi:hypothetical protein
MNEASLEQLEQSLRGHESLSVVDDFNGLTKRYIEYGDTIKNLKGELEGKVAIPKEDTPEADRNAFYNKIGRPETSDGYDFEKPDLPDGRKYDEVLEGKLKAIAHKHGVSKAALKALHKVTTEHGNEQHANLQKFIKEANEKDLNTLKDIWQGEDFDVKSKKADATLTAVLDKMNIPESLGGKDGMVKAFENLGLTGENFDPHLKYFMSSLFGLIGEDHLINNAGGGGGGNLTEEQRLAEKYPEMVNK